MAKDTEVALGFAVHTGWAAALAVAGSLTAPRVELRETVAMVDRKNAFVYHAAAARPLDEAECALARIAADARARATQAMARMLEQLGERGLKVSGLGLVASKGASDVPLAEVLASHPRIHTAEGLFYRDAVMAGAKENGIAARTFPPKQLEAIAAEELRVPGARLATLVTQAGRVVGRPWARDQKLCALAGWVVLQ
jgi:hypothetical protein